MMLKYLIQTSIFRYSKNYGSLTHETRIKDAVNMGDLICLLATVRTLKSANPESAMFFICLNSTCVLQIARNGHVFFYRICHPHMAKSYIWWHANYLLASTLVFLDGRKINLTKIMTFLMSLGDLQFCWYNVHVTLLGKMTVLVGPSFPHEKSC